MIMLFAYGSITCYDTGSVLLFVGWKEEIRRILVKRRTVCDRQSDMRPALWRWLVRLLQRMPVGMEEQ